MSRGTQRFTLSAHDAGVKADVGGMVDEALKASRDGSIFSRVARDITGGEEDAQVSARVTYSTDAVEQLVEAGARASSTGPPATPRWTSRRSRR